MSEKRELFMAYMKGWRDGASRKSFNSNDYNDENKPGLYSAYDDGFNAGHNAQRLAQVEGEKKFDYKQLVIGVAKVGT